MNIVVYCSSRAGLPEEVEAGARLIAGEIGRNGASLVYGGVNAGLMHVVAEAAAKAGAGVIGVVPEVFAHRADPLCTTLFTTSDLNTRKARMIQLADVFIVLPGGIGTIDEWISTLSDIMVRETVDPAANRPILVWNHQGLYNGLASQLAATAESVYARGKRLDRSLIFKTPEALAASLRALLQK